MGHMNSFGSRSVLGVGSREYVIYRIDALDKQGISTTHLPYSLRILLENLLRTEDGRSVKAEEIRLLAAWNGSSIPTAEIVSEAASAAIENSVVKIFSTVRRPDVFKPWTKLAPSTTANEVNPSVRAW